MNLEDAQPGDQVIRHGTDRKEVADVVRTTKTQLIIANDERYNRTTGYVIGEYGVCRTWSVSIPLEGEVEALLCEARCRKLRRQIIRACQLEPFATQMGEDRLKEIHALLRKDG